MDLLICVITKQEGGISGLVFGCDITLRASRGAGLDVLTVNVTRTCSNTTMVYPKATLGTVYVYHSIYTPNLGFEIAVPGREREPGRS